MKIKSKKIFNTLSTVILASTLAACGGGSSSSDSGGTSPVDSKSVYNGSQNLTISSNGVSESTSGNIRINLDGRTVTITIGNESAQGSLTDQNFTVTVSQNNVDVGSGVICSLEATYTGSLNSTTASGNINGGGTCSSLGLSIPINLSGNFSAN